MSEARIKEIEEELEELQIKYDNYEYRDTGWEECLCCSDCMVSDRT
jgi:hypothetical protein